MYLPYGANFRFSLHGVWDELSEQKTGQKRVIIVAKEKGRSPRKVLPDARVLPVARRPWENSLNVSLKVMEYWLTSTNFCSQ